MCVPVSYRRVYFHVTLNHNFNLPCAGAPEGGVKWAVRQAAVFLAIYSSSFRALYLPQVVSLPFPLDEQNFCSEGQSLIWE